MRGYRSFMIIAVLAIPGCARKAPEPPPGPPPSPPAAQSSPVPKLPDSIAKTEDDAPTGMEILVRNPTDARAKAKGYRQDDRAVAGRLVGVVRFAGNVVRRDKLPPARKLDTAEALAIPDPKPGEVDYFLNTKLVEDRYLHHDLVQPIGTVIMLRGIKSGRRAMFIRATYLLREGRFRPPIQFAPPDERVMFGTYDSHPTDLQIKGLSSGKLVMDGEVSGYDRSKIRQLGGGGVELKPPDMAQSEVIHELGGYAITSRRHAWKKGYLFVVDNPYALVSDGKFMIEDAPVGTWTLEVWHPLYKPIKPTVEVRIEEDGTTEIAVELEPPEALKAGDEKK